MKAFSAQVWALSFVSLCVAGSAQTKEEQKVCNSKGSAVVYVYCPLLAQEFDKKDILNGSYLDSDPLFSPMGSATLFVPALRNRAYLHVLAKTVTTNAKIIGKEDAQLLANELAQLISTKASTTQTGATSSASGSTTLTPKAVTTDFISLAAESGAFTQTVNGNTLTAQANLNGLRRYVTGKPFASLSSPTAEDILQHMTVGATFNIAQSASSAAATTGTATTGTPADILAVLVPSNNVSFNGLNASVEVLRPYSPTSSSFNKAWAASLNKTATQSAALGKKLYADYSKVVPTEALPDYYKNHPALQKAFDEWKDRAKEDEGNKDFDRFLGDFVTYINALVDALESDPNFDQNIVNTGLDLDGLKALRDEVIDEARGKPLLTFKYDYTTPANQPAMHEATGVISYVWKNGAQLTGDVAGEWFASVPADAKYGRLKDYQVTGEFDKPIGADPAAPRAIASLAGYGQYQYEPNVLNVTVANLVPGTNITVPANSQVFTGTAGWLGVAQAKLVFNIGKGMSVPVAAKWSNKTELLTDSNWKGQFGISYDLSALKSILLGTGR